MKKEEPKAEQVTANIQSGFKPPKVETCPSCKSRVFEEDICCFCDCCMGNSKDRFALNAYEPCCQCPEWDEM
jgi:hypothetical protein